MLRSVTHLPLSFIGSPNTGSVPMRPVISPSCSTSITTSVSGSPSATHYTLMGGNQRPLFSIRRGWPECNPHLSFSQEPLKDWKLTASQCPISLLVYPLNCEDGWKGGLTSHRDLQGRVALKLDGPERSFVVSLSLTSPLWELPAKRQRNVETCYLRERQLFCRTMSRLVLKICQSCSLF